MFREDSKFNPEEKAVIVHNGVMKIRNYDSEDRFQIIPLWNVEFIERIWVHLTFHMKSGARHTIYVGDYSPTSFDNDIMNEYAKYCATALH